MTPADAPLPAPTLLPLGDNAVLVRFADSLSDAANRKAVAFAAQLEADLPEGVEEIAPGLVSVLLRTKPGIDFWRLSGELRLRMGEDLPAAATFDARMIPIIFDGDDLDEVCTRLTLTPGTFVARHNAAPLRVLATGFAPGFVYCGFHAEDLVMPRREQVRPSVPAGTVLFAAGQTAIAATAIRTGWHIIGRTTFQNFDPKSDPPTILRAGDAIHFTVAT